MAQDGAMNILRLFSETYSVRVVDYPSSWPFQPFGWRSQSLCCSRILPLLTSPQLYLRFRTVLPLERKSSRHSSCWSCFGDAHWRTSHRVGCHGHLDYQFSLLRSRYPHLARICIELNPSFT